MPPSGYPAGPLQAMSCRSTGKVRQQQMQAACCVMSCHWKVARATGTCYGKQLVSLQHGMHDGAHTSCAGWCLVHGQNCALVRGYEDLTVFLSCHLPLSLDLLAPGGIPSGQSGPLSQALHWPLCRKQTSASQAALCCPQTAACLPSAACHPVSWPDWRPPCAERHHAHGPTPSWILAVPALQET